MAVKSAHRRRGIAAALVAEIEQRLTIKGATKVDTLVKKDNIASLGFFESLGYERDPEYMLLGKLLVENWKPPNGIDRLTRFRKSHITSRPAQTDQQQIE